MTELSNRFVDLANSLGEALYAFAGPASLQVAALVAALFLIDWGIRRRARAVFRYAMWSLVLVKLVLPVSFGTPASVGYWIRSDQPPNTPRERETPESPAATLARELSTGLPLPAVLPPSDPIRQTIGDGAIASNTVIPPTDSAKPPAADVRPAVSAASATYVMRPLRPTGWLLVGWAGIVALLTGLFVRRGLDVRRMAEQATQPPADAIRDLTECCATLGVRNRVDLKLSERLHSPAICGLWNPTILLPARLLDKLDSDQLRLVFLHELMHWKRGDLQVQFVQGLLQILYFFHPAVWLANAKLRYLREQAVDEAVLAATSSNVRYSETLVDIWTSSRPAPLLTRGLLGIVESRRALAERIRRIVERPSPKSAKVGICGATALAILGLVLLPMAGGSRAERAEQKIVVAQAKTPPANGAKAKGDAARDKAKAAPMLSGRIIDDAGAPVTDATIELSHRAQQTIRAKTDAEGRYRFDQIGTSGEFQVAITSQRCISVRDADELPRLNLAVGAPVVRDFTLKRACQVRIRAVDEAGKPVAGVEIQTSNVLLRRSFNVAETVTTDRDGRAVVGGLAPAKGDYQFGAMHRDYGLARLLVPLSDSGAVVERELVMQAGKEIQGNAVCSDGKPPAGWSISAHPTWWNYSRWGHVGSQFGEDGSFKLRHVVEGTYDVFISIPREGGGSGSYPVLRTVDLAAQAEPLSIKLDQLSEASLATLEVQVQYVGGAPRNNISVTAQSLDQKQFGHGQVSPRGEKLVLRGLQHGTYTLEFTSVEIEPLTMKGVKVPSKPLEVEIRVVGIPSFRGKVISAETNKPVTAFRIRVEKRQTLRGPNYVESPSWREFKDPQGRFEVPVNGPGVYVLHVAADGLAAFSSDPLNTDSDKGREVAITMLKPGTPAAIGASIIGLVVDPSNQPVDGAIVRARSKGSRMIQTDSAKSGDGVTTTDRGRFRLDGFKPGQETLQITHPDFAQAFVDVEAAIAKKDDKPVSIPLKRGSTVNGRVYDTQGRPEAGVVLTVWDRQDFSRDAQGEFARLAVATSDAQGQYEFPHIPDRECEIGRLNKWESQGVVTHLAWPRDGQPLALDFGGTTEVSGQLFVNGVPAGRKQLILSDGTYSQGTTWAVGRSEADGSFVFRGIPPGRRSLFLAIEEGRPQYVRVGTFLIGNSGKDLGKIDAQLAELSVRLVKPANFPTLDIEWNLIDLEDERPFPFGRVVPVESDEGLYRVRNVPVGRYEVVAWHSSTQGRAQSVEVTAANLKPNVAIRLGGGSASIKGKVDPAKASRWMVGAMLQVRSRNDRFTAIARAELDGDFRFVGLPPGEYDLTTRLGGLSNIRDPDSLMRITLTNDATKSVDLTDAIMRDSAASAAGFLVVTAFSSNGLILPGCKMKLERQGQTMQPQRSHSAYTYFAGLPGTYELTAEFPGFEPVRKSVTMESVDRKRPTLENYGTQVTLRPVASP